MDIYCIKCGEPVERDYLHDVAEEKGTTFNVVLHQFQSVGCPAVGYQHSDNGEAGADRAAAMSAMFDLLGDDVDGAAAMMEDFDLY